VPKVCLRGKPGPRAAALCARGNGAYPGVSMAESKHPKAAKPKKATAKPPKVATKQPKAATKPPKAPPKRAALLAEARDPQTSTARLTELSKMPRIGYSEQREIARNPNASVEVLRRLADSFPREVEGNMAWTLEVLADPSLAALTQLPRARHGYRQEELIELARIGNLEVRRAVARNSSTPAEALVLLGQGDDPDIASALARHPKSPPELLARLARGPAQRDLAPSLLRHPATPADELRRLVPIGRSDRRRAALATLVENPLAPGDLLAEAAAHPELRLAVAAHPKAPREVLTAMAQDPDLNLLRAVASNPATPPELLDAVAHEHPGVRLRVAENPACSTPTLLWLAHDPQAPVRQAVADHRNTPLFVRQQLGTSRTRPG